MKYMELLKQSVESCSNGAVTLIPVPVELRLSSHNLSALQYEMFERIFKNEAARRRSYRHV